MYVRLIMEYIMLEVDSVQLKIGISNLKNKILKKHGVNMKERRLYASVRDEIYRRIAQIIIEESARIL